MRRLVVAIAAIAALVVPNYVTAGPAADAIGQLEDRVASLEARVAALEGGLPSASPIAPTATPSPTSSPAMPSPAPTPTSPPTSSPTPPSPSPSSTPVSEAPLWGFGSRATGGTTVVEFTTLADSGPGSLRDALRSGRIVRPAPGLAGTVRLSSALTVSADDWTLDGLGRITLTRPLFVSGSENFVVRNVRFRMESPVDEDAITVKFGARNGAIVGNSISGWTDGAIDVTRDCRDLTIAWNLIAEGDPDHNFAMLLGHQSSRMTVHHNLMFRTAYRNPQGFWNESTTATANPTEVTVDVVNNVVWDFEDYGTLAARRGWVNATANLYMSDQRGSRRALRAETGGRLYAEGNVGIGVPIDGATESSPFPVPSWARVPATDALTAAREVLERAGARPLDAADAARIATVVLP